MEARREKIEKREKKDKKKTERKEDIKNERKTAIEISRRPLCFSVRSSEKRFQKNKKECARATAERGGLLSFVS